MNRALVASRADAVPALLTAGLLLTLLACSSAPALRPAPDAAIGDHGATATEATVTMAAEADAWAGTPHQIDGYTPIRIRLENDGDHPIRVRYDDLRVAAGDSTVTPIDPRAIDGTEYVSPHNAGYGRSAYGSHGFHVASHHSGLSSGHGRHGGHGLAHGFGHGFGHGLGHGFHPGGYGYRSLRYGYGGHSRAVELPTRDMLTMAVPEGFLEPDGHVEGFLYFPTEKIPHTKREHPGSAPFTMTVVHAETNETLGEISIPFEYER